MNSDKAPRRINNLFLVKETIIFPCATFSIVFVAGMSRAFADLPIALIISLFMTHANCDCWRVCKFMTQICMKYAYKRKRSAWGLQSSLYSIFPPPVKSANRCLLHRNHSKATKCTKYGNCWHNTSNQTLISPFSQPHVCMLSKQRIHDRRHRVIILLIKHSQMRIR